MRVKSMTNNPAKVKIIKEVLTRLADGKTTEYWTHKDLFNPMDWADKGTQDTAASKSWTKEALQYLLDLKIITMYSPPEGSAVTQAYCIADAEAARKLKGDDEALFHLLSPKDCLGPPWLLDRLPAVMTTSRVIPNDRSVVPGGKPTDSSGGGMESFAKAIIFVGDMVQVVLDTVRKIEDRVNKFDVKAGEDRTKTMQIIAAHVADLRQCVTEQRGMIDEQQTMILDMATKQDVFLQKIAEQLEGLQRDIKVDHQQLVQSLDLFSRYSQMATRVSGMSEAVKTMQQSVNALSSMTGAVEVGMEGAMELASKMEKGANHAAR